jgi:hypothetical protein
LIDYRSRQAAFVVITCVGSFVSQGVALVLLNWNEKEASDAWRRVGGGRV